MEKSNCFEIVFLRRIAIVRDFSLIGVKRNFDNKKLEICFLGHSEK